MYPYKDPIHGGDIASVLEENLPGSVRGILDFSSNINPLGMPAPVKKAFAECAGHIEHYPDAICRRLRGALSDFEGVPADWILCGAGAVDLIFRLAFWLRPRRALLFSPTFAEYELALRQTGCECVFHKLEEKRGFSPDASLLGQIEGCDLVLLCNPNNPTGTTMRPELMRRALNECKRTGAVLAVDECFMDFLTDLERYSLKKELGGYDKLIILRAFTKIFAMPGLRLGHALCSGVSLLRGMDEAGPSWNVSVPAQLCGIAAAGEKEFLRCTRQALTHWRGLLYEQLVDCGLRVYPGSANYIFFYSGCFDLAARLRQKGILIRDCANYRGLFPGYFRVAVRAEQENNILIEALKECLL